MLVNCKKTRKIPIEKSFSTYFSSIFPLFSKSLRTYFKIFALKYFKYPQNLIKCDEIIANHIEEWSIMSSFNDHKIAIHVYKMLFSLQNDPDFLNLPEYDGNILLWACLLHDIAKRGAPICEHRDHIHPFKGAYMALKIFKRLGFLENEEKMQENEEKLYEEWEKTFEKAVKKDEKGGDIHDNSQIAEIYRVLCEILKGNEFEKDVIMLILLHQSLPSHPKFDYHVVLKPLYEEVAKYFNRRLMRLMGFIIKHDSLSYLLGGKSWEIKEYSQCFDGIIKDIMENTQWEN